MANKQKLSGEVPARVVPSPPGSDPPLAWLVRTIDRARAGNSKAALVAQNNLDVFLGWMFSDLFGLALHEGDATAKQWAVELLARLKVSLEKHDAKLSANPAYGGTQAKLGKLRIDVLLPNSPITHATQCELQKAERYRMTLLRLRGLYKTDWRKAAQKKGIPEDYFPTVNLPHLSSESVPEWLKYLWPRVEKEIDLSKLRPLKQHAPKGGVKNRTRYRSDSQKTCRDHLKTLARLRNSGIL